MALLPGEDRGAVPDDLVRAHTFPVATLDLDGVEPLLRRLVGLSRRPPLTGLGA